MMRVLGVPQALAKFAALATGMQQASQPAVAAVSEQIAAQARARVPVLTGETRATIEVTSVGVEASSASLFLEFGTVNMPAQPFLRPAADTATSAPAEGVLRAAIQRVV